MRIFLSYRRDDASAWAGRLRDTLSRRYGEGSVFQDVVTVRPGQQFIDAVNAALGRSDAVLAVIGPRWSTAVGADGAPRLGHGDDYVRAELVAALASGTRVIPVLVGGAKMPDPAELPDDLRPLTTYQAVTLRDESWQRDVDGLIGGLGGKHPAVRRRRWIIGAAVLGAALVAAGAAVLLVSSDDGAESSATTQGVASPGASTSFDPTSKLGECETPTAAAGWKPLGVSGSTEVRSGDRAVATVDLTDGQYRKADGDHWQVTLGATVTNLTDASQFHYWWFYALLSGAVSSSPECFSVIAGSDPSSPGAWSTALVGFVTTADPTNGASLLVDMAGDRARIELRPT
jgi:TIR domain